MPRYSANFNYFDEINTPNQAYWLGFIWADGYIGKRIREQKNGNKKIEYNLKLSLMEEDSFHVQKFLNDINSNYLVNFYKTKGFSGEVNLEARAFITNQHMCGFLYEELGIVPRRTDATNLISHVPVALHKYFILGLFDADGSFSAYQNDKYGEKLNISFGGSENVLRFIENHLKDNHITTSKEEHHKLHQRHKNADSEWRTLNYSGKRQGMNILNYLYDSPIYLDRKYQKFLDIPYYSN